jgi:hypothetical protein
MLIHHLDEVGTGTTGGFVTGNGILDVCHCIP